MMRVTNDIRHISLIMVCCVLMIHFSYQGLFLHKDTFLVTGFLCAMDALPTEGFINKSDTLVSGGFLPRKDALHHNGFLLPNGHI